MLANSGRARIPPIARLRQQLAGLERRTSRSGKDSVDHRPGAGAHDDVANAVAGALVLAAKPARPAFLPYVIEIPLNRTLSPPPSEWKDPHANLGPYDFGPESWWHKQ